MAVGQEANLDGLWPKRSKRRHQTLQGPPDSLRTMSAVPGGMQQEHHVQQGLWTHWALCDSGLGVLHAILDRCQGEDVGDARL